MISTSYGALADDAGAETTFDAGDETTFDAAGTDGSDAGDDAGAATAGVDEIVAAGPVGGVSTGVDLPQPVRAIVNTESTVTRVGRMEWSFKGDDASARTVRLLQLRFAAGKQLPCRNR